MSTGQTMQAAQLLGPKDIRLVNVPAPAPPGHGEVQISVDSVGICGSDLHMFQTGRIGDTVVESPLILGHEFGGTISAVSEGAIDGDGTELSVGMRVAIDPAIPCGRCELCRTGHPNLCPNHTFMGVWPTPGALCEKITVPADGCFFVPDQISHDEVPLLETLGVAIHAVDLAHIHVGQSVAVIGAGAIGLCIAQVAMLAGATPVFITDRLTWRLELAEQFDAVPLNIDGTDAVQQVNQATGGRGVDVTIEAAWSDESSITQAVDMLRPGGRLVVVGIADDDALHFQHSKVRRKGITIAMCRRMKHTYPRAISLTQSGKVDLKTMVSHRFNLKHTADAFTRAAQYQPGCIKAVVHPNS